MNEIDRIQDQLRRAFEGEAWHGPAVKEVLAGIDARVAAARPIAQAHSIWEITHHIAAWEGIVAARVRGTKVEVTTEVDWPPVGETSEAAWQRSLASLESGHAALADAIGLLEESRLSETIGPKRSLYGLLHGVIQHYLYHAGQIAIFRKA